MVASPWPFSFDNLFFPAERYVWVPIRILHETKKAVLVYHGAKFWIPKSQVQHIRLRRNTFEIYVREGLLV